MRPLFQLLFALFLAVTGGASEGRKPVAVPPEARQVLAHVQATGQPLPGYVGGRPFGNRERRLPQRTAEGRRIHYQEWDIHPRVPGQNRGPERLVTSDNHRAWYTPDHYATFVEILR